MVAHHKNKIYSTIGSGASRFAELVTAFTLFERSSLTVIEDGTMPMLDGSENTCGIYFAEPAVLLKRYYLALKKTQNITQSFSEFCQTDTHVSGFFLSLQNRQSLDGLLLIDDTCVLKSLMMHEAPFAKQLGKIPYGQLFKGALDTKIEPQQREEIEALYEDEYKIYGLLKARFAEQWLQFSASKEIKAPLDKDAVIHVGPPKTGTSALQRWFSDNSASLLEKGIYYPKHGSDSNGISSGNFSYFISFKGDGTPYFDHGKTASIIGEFAQRKQTTLLMSSEHFYYFLPWLFTSLPKAHYVFYIRHPIALFESGYHQQVKRHDRTDRFQTPNKVSFNNLNVIARIASEFGISVNYRYFDTASENGGSIYHDFASCFATFIAPPLRGNKVNTKYSAGALALMSQANKFAHAHLKEELDLWLQKVSETADDFSLIPPQKLAKLNEQLLVDANKLATLYEDVDMAQMKTLIHGYQPAQHFTDSDIQADLNVLLAQLKREKPLLAYSLLGSAFNQQNQEAFQALRVGLNYKYYSRFILTLAGVVMKLKILAIKVSARLRK